MVKRDTGCARDIGTSTPKDEQQHQLQPHQRRQPHAPPHTGSTPQLPAASGSAPIAPCTRGQRPPQPPPPPPAAHLAPRPPTTQHRQGGQRRRRQRRVQRCLHHRGATPKRRRRHQRGDTKAHRAGHTANDDGGGGGCHPEQQLDARATRCRAVIAATLSPRAAATGGSRARCASGCHGARHVSGAKRGTLSAIRWQRAGVERRRRGARHFRPWAPHGETAVGGLHIMLGMGCGMQGGVATAAARMLKSHARRRAVMGSVVRDWRSTFHDRAECRA